MASERSSGLRIKRVRTGCWTCRRRGYRCDEAKPSCQSCMRLRLDCEGYGVRLRWVTATNEPSKLNKSPNRWSGNGPNKSPKPGRPSGKGLTPSDRGLRPSEAAPDPSTLPALPPGLSKNDIFIIQHFFYTISGLLASTSDRSINVYCHLMLPMALSSNLVLDAVLLLSATHLSSRYDTFHADSTRYRARVLRGLIDRIGTYRGGGEGFELTTLATILLLSMTEVFEGRSPEDWVKHLGAAGKMIGNRLSYRKRPLDRSTRMVLDIFAYHNVLAMVATGGGQPSLYVEEFYADSKWASLSGQRTAFLANVDTLLSIAARLSSLSGRRHRLPGDQTAALVDRLGQQLRYWAPPEGIEPHTSSTAEAMRQATLILYHNLALTEKATRCRETLRSSELIVCHLRGIPVQSSTVASHVWPLYMAGSVLTDAPDANPLRDEQRRFIRDRLVAMWSERGIKSIDAVRMRLEEMWAANADERTRGGTVILF